MGLLVELLQIYMPVSFWIENENVQEGVVNFESYVSDVSDPTK